MAVLQARIFASVYGTAAQLGASNVILGYGERWYRTDAPIVTDPASPFYNKPDPAFRWKTGDNTKKWSQLDYDPIGSGGGSGSSPELDPGSVLANIGADPATGDSLLITPDPGNADAPNLRDLLGLLNTDDFDALAAAVGTVSTAEANAGGLRFILDSFMNLRATPTITVTGNITTGSDVVTLSSPLDKRINPWARVFVNAGGTGLGSPVYINSIATDRLSFRVTSTMFNFVDGAGTPMNATATGSRSFDIKDPGPAPFGVYLNAMMVQNPFNGVYSIRSTPNSLANNTITGETVEKRYFNGLEFIRAAQVNGGAWEQQSGASDLILWNKSLVAPITPTAHHTWSTFPATATEFMGETNGRHRFNLTIPDDNFTQFMILIDTLIVAGTNTSTMWVEFLDPADTTGGASGTWKDICTTRITVSLNTPIDTAKQSAWGTIATAAKVAAALRGDRGVYCRLMGQTTGPATGNPQFTNVWTIIK